MVQDQLCLRMALNEKDLQHLDRLIEKYANRIEEEKLRQEFPALREAWENYQTILALVRQHMTDIPVKTGTGPITLIDDDDF